MKRTGMLYIHTGPTGKVYVGKTWQPAVERFNGNWLKTYTSKAFLEDIRKYGQQAFTTTILHRFESDNPQQDDSYLSMLEITAIRLFDTQIPNGYNTHKGGGGGAPRSAEICAKLSGSGNPMFGRKHKKSTLKELAVARQRDNLPEEQRMKMREAQKTRPRDAHGHYIKQGADYHPNSLKRWRIKTP